MDRWPKPWSTTWTGQQLLAVEDRSESVLIIGTYSNDLTRLLCSRGLRLMHEGIQPEKVVYLTQSPGDVDVIRQTLEGWVQEGEREEVDAFTEDLRRSAGLLAINARRLLESQMLTMTQFCIRYLRDEGARLLDISPNFSILSHRHQLQLVSRLAAQDSDMRGLSSAELLEFLQWYRRNAATTNYLDEGYDHDDVVHDWIVGAIAVHGDERWATPQPPPDDAWLKFNELYREEKRRQGLLDLDEIMRTAARARRLTINHGLDTVAYGDHLLVDEVEGMTPASLDVILNEKVYFQTVTIACNPNLRVGTWRGTDSGSFMDLLKEYDEPSIHQPRGEEKSTRRLSEFLDKMTQIQLLEGLEVKNHRTYRARGDVPQLQIYEDRHHLIQSLLESVKNFQESGEDPQQLALLFRWPTTMDQCRESLYQAGIPCSVLGGPREIKGRHANRVISLLNLLYNPHDLGALSEAAALWTPTGWIEFNKFTAVAIEDASKQHGCDLIEAARRHIRTLTQRGAARQTLSRVVDGVDVLQQRLKEGVEDPVVIGLLIQAVKSLKEEKFDTLDRGDHLITLVDCGIEFRRRQGESTKECLRRFLDSIAIHGIIDQDQSGITLSTIQDAKAVYWEAVWVVEAGERLMPHGEGAQLFPLPLWEEQRQLYAAATRAEDHLIFFNLKDSDLGKVWGELVG